MRKRRPTAACSDLDHNKVHAPHCHAAIGLGDRAPREWRPVADTGRWATLRRKSTTFKNSAFIALSIVLTISASSAAEAMWPKNSASDLSIFVTLQRYRIYADHCSARIPQLKPKFESLMEILNSRIQGISKGLLASDAFRGMEDKPVPAAIVFALKDTVHDAEHNLERQDAGFICPKTLQDLGDIDDESLRLVLSETLTAVQNMTRNMEKESAR
jgi:hypothetical protein